MINRVIFLSEGNSHIGLGHISRLSSLYYEIKNLIFSEFYIMPTDIQFKDPGFTICDWKNFGFISNSITNSDCVVIDSYSTTYNFNLYISKYAGKVIFIDDDIELEKYSKGIQRGMIIKSTLCPYNLDKEDKIKILSGKEHILLREPFRSKEALYMSNSNYILITIGGSDIRNLSYEFAKWIHEFNEQIKVKIILPKRSVIISNDEKTEILNSLNEYEMMIQMMNAKFVITGCGQTLYELLAIGVPFFPIKIVENQVPNVLALKEMNYCAKVSNYDDISLKEDFLEYLRSPYTPIRLHELQEGVSNIVKEVLKYIQED